MKKALLVSLGLFFTLPVAFSTHADIVRVDFEGVAFDAKPADPNPQTVTFGERFYGYVIFDDSASPYFRFADGSKDQAEFSPITTVHIETDDGVLQSWTDDGSGPSLASVSNPVVQVNDSLTPAVQDSFIFAWRFGVGGNGNTISFRGEVGDDDWIQDPGSLVGVDFASSNFVDDVSDPLNNLAISDGQGLFNLVRLDDGSGMSDAFLGVLTSARSSGASVPAPASVFVLCAGLFLLGFRKTERRSN